MLLFSKFNYGPIIRRSLISSLARRGLKIADKSDRSIKRSFSSSDVCGPSRAIPSDKVHYDLGEAESDGGYQEGVATVVSRQEGIRKGASVLPGYCLGKCPIRSGEAFSSSPSSSSISSELIPTTKISSNSNSSSAKEPMSFGSLPSFSGRLSQLNLEDFDSLEVAKEKHHHHGDGVVQDFMQITTAPSLRTEGRSRQLSPSVGEKKVHLNFLPAPSSTELRRSSILVLDGVNRRQLHNFTSAFPGGDKLNNSNNIVLGSRVREALLNREPIVALESTLITHGLPEPQNLQLALELEKIISNYFLENIVTPATIGVIKGQLIVGLSRDEIEFLANINFSKPAKASRRDIPIVMALKLNAGTTVSATMAIASSVRMFSSLNGKNIDDQRIRVFATGGTGGVHKGGELSMDISADLYEFARSPMGVVSSGFKSFLDTRRSLEFLETMGCPVVSLPVNSEGVGSYNINSTLSSSSSRDNLFPAFFSSTNSEGIKSPKMLASVEEAAKVLYFCLQASPLENQRAMLIANPIPARYSLSQFAHQDPSVKERNVHQPTEHMMNSNNGAVVDDDKRKSIDKNLHQTGNALNITTLEQTIAKISDEIDKRQDLEGREKTPLILEKLNIVTGGKTLKANIELLKNNAFVGAQLAIEYAKLANSATSVGSDAARSAVYAYSVKLEKSEPTSERIANDKYEDNNNETHSGQQERSSSARFEVPTSSQTQTGDSVDIVKDASSRCKSPDSGSLVGPVVVGCTMIDMHVSAKIDDHFKNNPLHSGVTFEGRPHLTVGGVGRNLACAIELLGHKPHFITSLGRDNLASFAMGEFSKFGLTMESERLSINSPEEKREELKETISSCFALVLADSTTGLTEYVIANLEAVQAINAQSIERNEELIRKCPLVVMDANLSGDCIEKLIEICHQGKRWIFLEPTDKLALDRLVLSFKRIKGWRGIGKSGALGSILCMSPNLIELQAMVELFRGRGSGTMTRVRTEDAHSLNDQQLEFEGQNNNTIEWRDSIWEKRLEKGAPGDGESGLEKKGEEESEDKQILLQAERLASELMGEHLPELKCLLVTLDKRGVLVAVRSSSSSPSPPSPPSPSYSIWGDNSQVGRGGGGEKFDREMELMEDQMGEMKLMQSERYQMEGPDRGRLLMKHFKPPTLVRRVVSGSGAGDSFAAGFVSGLLRNGSLNDCLAKGFKASQLTLEDKNNVSPNLRLLNINGR